MIIVKTLHDILEALSLEHTALGIVAYTPLSLEPDIRPLFTDTPYTTSIHYTPQSQTADPFLFAENIQHTHKNEMVLLFIPGQLFDMSGTRHGRGGGWYDRFLSRVPQHWIRIGVLQKQQLSETILTRKLWDEPVDALLIASPQGWQFMVTAEKRDQNG